MTHQIPTTPASLELFVTLWADRSNWGGEPLIDITAAQRGNLTDLKKKGLITTFKDEGCEYAQFTDDGNAFAAQLKRVIS